MEVMQTLHLNKQKSKVLNQNPIFYIPVSGVQNSRKTKRNLFSDLDSDVEADLSVDDLKKLVLEKEELLKMKHKEIERMQDKVLRAYADMENVMDRTKREAENSKKFAIQVSSSILSTDSLEIIF